MRIWHKDLILVLPEQQLIAQWRECCCIARNITVNGTPNHILVNKAITYPSSHLYTYAMLVAQEMTKRGCKVDKKKFLRWMSGRDQTYIDPSCVYCNWHNDRYFIQCYFNLQEKYDCGGITTEDWEKIHHLMEEKIIFKRGAKS